MKHRTKMIKIDALRYKEKRDYIAKYKRRVTTTLYPNGEALIDVSTAAPYTTEDYLYLNCPDLDTRFPTIKKMLSLCQFPELISDKFLEEFPMFNFSPKFIPPKLHKDEYYMIRSNNAPQLRSLEGTIVKVVSIQTAGIKDLYKLRVSCTQKRRFQATEITLVDTHGKHELLDIFIPIKRKEN